MDGTISIKGTREGLTVTLGVGSFENILGELAQHLEAQGGFFRGGLVALRVGERAVEAHNLSLIRDLLSKHDMVLRTVVTSSEETRQAADDLGLRVVEAGSEAGVDSETGSPSPRKSIAEPSHDRTDTLARAGTRGLILRRRLRAGQSVRHTGSVVIVGDVNVGAEVVAGGDVVVWGRLRGTVHAGYLGNTSAIVCALDFAPLQLRIGNLITRPEENDGERHTIYPEVAYVRQNTIVVERWNGIHWGE